MSDEAAIQAEAARRYRETRDAAVAIGRLAVLTLDLDALDEAIDAGEHSHTVAPFLDPTLFIKAGPTLRETIEFLRIVRAFRRAVETFRPDDERGPTRLRSETGLAAIRDANRRELERHGLAATGPATALDGAEDR